jgi:hypothetical protein
MRADYNQEESDSKNSSNNNTESNSPKNSSDQNFNIIQNTEDI